MRPECRTTSSPSTRACLRRRSHGRWYPDKPALYYFDMAISYGELDEITDVLAAALQAQGFQPGERLAVYLQNVPQFPIAMIASWKAGGIMVSVSPMPKHKGEAAHCPMRTTSSSRTPAGIPR